MKNQIWCWFKNLSFFNFESVEDATNFKMSSFKMLQKWKMGNLKMQQFSKMSSLKMQQGGKQIQDHFFSSDSLVSLQTVKICVLSTLCAAQTKIWLLKINGHRLDHILTRICQVHCHRVRNREEVAIRSRFTSPSRVRGLSTSWQHHYEKRLRSARYWLVREFTLNRHERQHPLYHLLIQHFGDTEQLDAVCKTSDATTSKGWRSAKQPRKCLSPPRARNPRYEWDDSKRAGNSILQTEDRAWSGTWGSRVRMSVPSRPERFQSAESTASRAGKLK